MLRRVLTAALLAGAVGGVVATVGQMVEVTPLILEAELYETGEAAAAHSHAHAEADWQRTALTLLTNILIGIGFGLLLAAAIVLRGRPVSARQGVLWGGAGFLVFSALPALGLPPELPGAAAADLASRQVWWLSVVVLSAGGLSLVAFAPRRLLKALGIALLVAPHAIGAPHVHGEQGVAPPELAAAFAVASLAVTAAFWAALGASLGHALRKLPLARQD